MHKFPVMSEIANSQYEFKRFFYNLISYYIILNTYTIYTLYIKAECSELFLRHRRETFLHCRKLLES